MNRVILEHVGHVLAINERIVDGNDLDVIAFHSCSCDQTSNSTETCRARAVSDRVQLQCSMPQRLQRSALYSPLMPILTFSLLLEVVAVGGFSAATALMLASALTVTALTGANTVCALRALDDTRLWEATLHCRKL